MKRILTLLPLLSSLAFGLEVQNDAGAPGQFAADEIQREAAAKGSDIRIVLKIHPDDKAPQSYRIQREGEKLTVTGADAVGAMYGGLDIAEAIRTGTLDSLKDTTRSPHIKQRGIKFNIPLDLRTPSYTDCSDAAQAKIPEMWERGFWTAFLDAMARNRYNVLSLGSLHPFPSLVKVPEFPEVALDDVWSTRAKLDDTFSFSGTDSDKTEHAAALRHLGEALGHWKKYTAIRDARYVPALCNRVGFVDITALTEKAAADLEIARGWKPGTLKNEGKRSGTEKGFRQ